MEQKKKGRTVGAVLLAILLVLAVVVNVVLTGPLYTVMNMYFGKGDAIIEDSESSANIDGNYYTSDYASAEELLSASEELAERIEGEGIVLLKNDNSALPLSDGERGGVPVRPHQRGPHLHRRGQRGHREQPGELQDRPGGGRLLGQPRPL